MLTWTGSLSPGDSATVTYSVTVSSPDTGDQAAVNAAASSAAGSSCTPGSTTAPCRGHRAVLTPALTIVQTAATTSGSNAVATPGGVVSYTITVANTGQVPYTGAAFTDPLAGVLDDAAYNGDAGSHRRQRVLRQPEPDLDRGPGARGTRRPSPTRSR